MKMQVDLYSEDWLRQSGWEPSHETILIIHGYAGGDDTLPITVLRDGETLLFIPISYRHLLHCISRVIINA